MARGFSIKNVNPKQLQDAVDTAQSVLFPLAEENPSETALDLRQAKNYADCAWENFLNYPQTENIMSVYSLSQLMRIIMLMDIDFDNQAHFDGLIIIFQKHFPYFLANEQKQSVKENWADFFNHPTLFAKPDHDLRGSDKTRCAARFALMMQNPKQLLKWMSNLAGNTDLWSKLDPTAKNYAVTLRSLVDASMDPATLKELINLFSFPAMEKISKAFFFENGTEAVFEQNILLMETLLQASKKEKDPLLCLEPIKHKLTPDYLYALLPIIERIHPGNEKVVKSFLWHANKAAMQANPKDALKTIPIRIMVDQLQVAIDQNAVSPMQKNIIQHPLIAQEMLRTRDTLAYKNELRKKHWFSYLLFPDAVLKKNAEENNLHNTLQKKIVKQAHLDIDLEQRVRDAYPTLSKLPILWRLYQNSARQQFVSKLIRFPQIDKLDYHHVCAKVALDPLYNQFLQVKPKSGLFNFSNNDDALLMKTKIAAATPFLASVVFKQSLTESFLGASPVSIAILLEKNNEIKEFNARQAFSGATIIEKIALIQKYQVPQAPQDVKNPFLELIDPLKLPLLPLLLKSHLTKLVSQYTPGKNQESADQKNIYRQLTAFIDVLLFATEQIDKAPKLYEENGVLDFKKILNQSLLIDLISKGLINCQHETWLDFTGIATTLSGNNSKADLPDAVRKLHSAVRSADLVHQFEQAIYADLISGDEIIAAGGNIWQGIGPKKSVNQSASYQRPVRASHQRQSPESAQVTPIRSTRSPSNAQMSDRPGVRLFANINSTPSTAIFQLEDHTTPVVRQTHPLAEVHSAAQHSGSNQFAGEDDDAFDTDANFLDETYDNNALGNNDAGADDDNSSSDINFLDETDDENGDTDVSAFALDPDEDETASANLKLN